MYTSASLFMLTCRFYIATHPEVEAKICAELASYKLLATRKHPMPRALEHDDLSELTYLGAAIKVRLLDAITRDQNMETSEVFHGDRCKLWHIRAAL